MLPIKDMGCEMWIYTNKVSSERDEKEAKDDGKTTVRIYTLYTHFWPCVYNKSKKLFQLFFEGLCISRPADFLLGIRKKKSRNEPFPNFCFKVGSSD